MFNEDTKNLIDFAYQDNGTAFRDSLYNAIHDKVSAHIEAKKQEIAAGLMGQQEEYVDEELDEGVRGVAPEGTCLASAPSSRPSIFSAKAHKGFDRVKNLSDKDSKDYHDTQIKRAKISQRLRSEDASLDEGMYADGKWHVIDNANGGYYKNSIHSTHETSRKAINAARKANADAPHEGRFSAVAASSIKKVANEQVELDEARKASLITGSRKIASYGDHAHTAEVRHNKEYNEYEVHHYKNGAHQGSGLISYHSDKDDAHDTAKYEVGMQPKVIKK